MGILESQLLAYQREDGTVQHLIFKMQGHRGLLATTEVFDVMLATYCQCMIEQLTLHSTGMFYLIHHTHIDLFPEAGHCRHTGGMRLTHGLLHLLRMGINNHRSTLGQRQDGPAALKDMGIGQEVHDTVLFTYRHTLVVGLKGCMELSMRQDDTLGISCCTTGVQDVGNIVEGGLLLQFLHFGLTGQVLTEFQEVVEIDGVRVMGGDMHHGIIDDDTFQRRAE